MAHFAEVSPEGIVLRVVVVNNDVMRDENGVEQESLGVAFCNDLFGQSNAWVQSSYSGSFRSRFAAPGYAYDSEANIFIAPEADEIVVGETISLP